MLGEKAGTMSSNLEPVTPLFHPIVEHGKCPHLAVLKPDKLIGIVHFARSIETSKITTLLPIDRVLLPKWQYIIQECIFVKLCEFLEIVVHVLRVRSSEFGEFSKSDFQLPLV